MSFRALVSVAIVALGAFASDSAVAGGKLPRAELRFSAEHTIEDLVDSGHNASRVEAELAVSLDWKQHMAIDLVAHVEPVRESSGRATFFEREDLVIETLTLRRQLGRVAFRAGKFVPPFGTAWNDAPGVYGSQFAEDYEPASAWGAEASVTLDPERWGTSRMAFGGWTADRSPLRTPVFGRGTALDAPGGTAWLFTLENDSIPAFGRIRARSTFLWQTQGERRASLAFAYRRALGPFSVESLAEFAAQRGSGRADQAGISSAIQAGLWQASLAYALRRAGHGVQHRTGLALGRSMGEGFRAALGWYRDQDSGPSGVVELRFGWDWDSGALGGD